MTTDLSEGGIIDPTKVTRSALQNAAARQHLAPHLRRPHRRRPEMAARYGGYEDMY
jgi:hypothetical protein